MSTPAITTQTGTQSIDRAAQLLVHLLETDAPPTVGELSARSGLPKSTTSRLVGALERQGLVQREPAGGLRPGAVLTRYARRETGEAELVELAAETLDLLAAETGETVNLGVPAPGSVELLDQRDSRHFLGSTNWVGRLVPAHGSALGKVFFAWGSLPLPAEPYAPPDGAATASDAAGLGLDGIRARGYATTVDELEPGLWAVAAPVRDGSGRVIAALSVSGPSVRVRRGLLDRIGRRLVAEADGVSARLGHDARKRGVA